jgi:O-acetyl-ADP-ribose deacetylase (regulator of RNase III)
MVVVVVVAAAAAAASASDGGGGGGGVSGDIQARRYEEMDRQSRLKYSSFK